MNRALLCWLLVLLPLSGCVVQDAKPLPKISATQAIREIPADERLDVVVHSFDTGIPEDIAGDGPVWAATAAALGRGQLDDGRSSLRLDNDPRPLERLARARAGDAAVDSAVDAGPHLGASVGSPCTTASECGSPTAPACLTELKPLRTLAGVPQEIAELGLDFDEGYCSSVPTCDDDAKNQDETGKDCGGPTCRVEPNGKCPDGDACLTHADCGSNFCSPGKLCAPAGCGNSAKDPNETDLDCGGDGCRATKPCALTQACVIHADCASGSCKSNKCVAASCSDGIKNQSETAIDCGGPTCSAPRNECSTASCEKNGRQRGF